MDKQPALDRPEPKGIALIVCDTVYSDSTGKRALVGLFNQINASGFPATHSRMCVYVSFTDVYPNTRCKLDIVHAETDAPVVEMEGSVPKEVKPPTICDMVFELRNVQFKDPGTYFIRFWGNGISILERPFKVQRLEKEATR